MKTISLLLLAGASLLSGQQSTVRTTANDGVLPTPLQSGVPVVFTLPAVEDPMEFFRAFSYSIKVPIGTTRLEINLGSEFDLDLYVRLGQPVADGDNGTILADYRSETVGGAESIVITGS